LVNALNGKAQLIILPNATLVFDVELVSVNNRTVPQIAGLFL